METISINNVNYNYYKPSSYENKKKLLKQIKQVKEKIRASETGCYKDKISKKGNKYYYNYPQLLLFLESLLV